MQQRSSTMEAAIQSRYPDLITLAQMYNNEALQTRKLITEDIAMLSHGAKILEVGGGTLAVAVQLAFEGFKVTTIEPVGSGFNPMKIFLEEYLRIAKKEGISLTFYNILVENFEIKERFNYAFAINVLEHVRDPALVITHVMSLPVNQFRIYCPNYDFPYEPHFGKFLWRRKNKAFFLPLQNATNSLLFDPVGLYKSLNFITFANIRKICLRSGLLFHTNNNVNSELFSRSKDDQFLNSRHRSLVRIKKILEFLGMQSFLRLMPLRWSPVIDVKISNPF